LALPPHEKAASFANIVLPWINGWNDPQPLSASYPRENGHADNVAS